MTNFIISDTHFNHEKILYFDKSRVVSLQALNIEPTIENMDRYLEDTWNETVTDEDTVIFLAIWACFARNRIL